MQQRVGSVAGLPSRPVRPVTVALSGLAALAVAIGIGRFAFTPLLPMMQSDAGISVSDGGWLAAANYVGYLLGALWAAAMPIRATRAIRGGLVVMTLATLAMSVDFGFAGWLLLRGIAGIVSAWVLVYTFAWCLERLSPLGRPMLNATLFSGVGTGIAIAGLLCLWLMAAKVSSASAWLDLGLIGLAVTVLVWPVFSSSAEMARPAKAAGRWTTEHVRLVLCYGAFGFGYIIPATFIPVMAREVVDDPIIFGWAWPVFGAAAATSTIAAITLLRKVGNRNLWIIAHIVMAIGVAAPVVWPGIPGIAVAALCVGGTFMVITMAGMQEGRRVAGANAAVMIAAMTAAFAAGQIAGPSLVSVLLSRGGEMADALLLASGFLTVSALALLIRRS
jgi:predicted MFS family arabinose efflux permease